MDDPALPPFDGVDDALAWLDSHVDFESNMPRRRALPTLDRMRALTSLLGEPQESIPSIHITGTNGKGSTSAMATALLMAKGLTVGTYTSPNLHARGGAPGAERRADRRRVADRRPGRAGAARDAAARAADPLRAADGGGAVVVRRPRRSTPWWSRWVSAGPGTAPTSCTATWRCSPTSASTTPTSWGPTLEGIAPDKAGIIEPGSRVVVGEMAPELVAIVTSRAEEVGAASVWVAGRDFGCETNRVAVGGRVVTLWTPGGRYEDVLVPLHGAHQGRERVGGAGGRRRRSSATRSLPTSWRRGSPPCACRVVSRCSVGARCCSSTARTTRRAWPRWPTR